MGMEGEFRTTRQGCVWWRIERWRAPHGGGTHVLPPPQEEFTPNPTSCSAKPRGVSLERRGRGATAGTQPHLSGVGGAWSLFRVVCWEGLTVAVGSTSTRNSSPLTVLTDICMVGCRSWACAGPRGRCGVRGSATLCNKPEFSRLRLPIRDFWHMSKHTGLLDSTVKHTCREAIQDSGGILPRPACFHHERRPMGLVGTLRTPIWAYMWRVSRCGARRGRGTRVNVLCVCTPLPPLCHGAHTRGTTPLAVVNGGVCA